jgi:hypothetical protein
MIQASEKLHVAVRQETHEIAGAIKSRSRMSGERMRDELFGGQIRAFEITVGESCAPDV